MSLDQDLRAAVPGIVDPRPPLSRRPPAAGVRLARSIVGGRPRIDVTLGFDVLDLARILAGDRVVYDFTPVVGPDGQLVLTKAGDARWPALRHLPLLRAAVVTLGAAPARTGRTTRPAEPCSWRGEPGKVTVALPVWFYDFSAAEEDPEWTPAMVAELVRRRKDGESLGELALSFGVTTGAIGWQLRRAGVYAKKRSEREQRERAKIRSAAPPRDRPCMSCGDVFRSEGIHNRMCASCRARSDGLPAQFGTVYAGSWRKPCPRG